MKITNKIFKVFIAFIMVFTGMIGNTAIFAKETKSTVNVPNTLNMDIKRLNGSTFQKIDVSQGYAISDLNTSKVTVTYQGGNNTVGNEITLTIPYFYSFDAIGESSFFTVKQMNDVNGGKGNQVVVAMNDDLSETGNPLTVSFDLALKVNRNSIDDAKEAAWKAGTWEPNQEAREFILEHNSNTTLTETMKIEQKSFNFENSVYLNLETRVSYDGSTDVLNTLGENFYGIDATIFKDGGGKYNGLESRCVIGATIRYNYPDLYTYAASDIGGLKFKMTLPQEFEFGDWVPDEFSKQHVKVDISADKKTAIYTLDDTFASSTNTLRNLLGLQIKAADEYATGKKYYPSNTEYPVNVEVLDKSGNKLTTKKQNLKVEEYTDSNRFKVAPAGTKDNVTGHLIITNVEPKNDFRIYQTASISNDRGVGTPLNEINSDGKGVSVTQTYDANLAVKEVQIVNEFVGWQYQSYLSESKWNRYSYNTNKRTNVTGSLDESVKEKFISLTDSDEYITSVTVTYDKFIYNSYASVFGQVVGKVNEKNENTNTEWKPGEDIPIVTNVKDKDGNELAKGTNYIRIQNLKCPTFTMGNTYLNKTSLGVGEYSNKETVTNAAMYLNIPYVGVPTYEDGTDSGVKATYISMLENPLFTVGGTFIYGTSFGGASKVAESIATNGKVNLAPIMGDGKWSVLIKTQSAEGARNNSTLKEYTVKLPAFTTLTQVNLATMANLPSDEYIVWFQMQHEGNLDISSLSNHYTDDDPSNGVAVDKMFFTVESYNYPISPLSGQYYEVDDSITMIHVSYDNCLDIDSKHLPSNDGVNLSGWGNAGQYKRKGAETFMLKWIEDEYEFAPKQGSNANLNIKISPIGSTSSNEYKLLSTGGEVFYFQLAGDAQKYLSFAKEATVDGMKTSAEVVTIDGSQYLKITNPIRKQYEKKYVSGASDKLMEAYDINLNVFAATLTPTNRNLEIFSNHSWTNLGTFVDWAKTAYQEYDLGGKTIRNALTYGSYDALGTGVDGAHSYARSVANTTDDYAGLYTGAKATDRHFITVGNNGFEKTSKAQAYQGVVLNPGIDHNQAESLAKVYPWERDILTTSLTLIAGQSSPMEDLISTIALPRKGVEVDDGGTKYTSDVSLYLTGPIKIDVNFGDPLSTKPEFKYSIDGGNTFVEESKITDWHKVTHFSIYVDTIAVGDGTSYTISMETDEKDKNIGKAYMPALFETSNLSAQSNRLNVYDFIGYTISGTAWEDTNKDGMIASSEAKLDTTMNLYQNYGEADEKLIASTNTDATTGEYSFHNVKEIENLTLVSELPSKKTVTVLNATTDNKFVKTDTGYAQYTFGNIDKHQVEINYGIRDLIEVTIGGADATTAITGLKTLSGSLKNTDIVKDQYLFNVDADSNNPINGTEGIPTTIKNDIGTSKGAALSFTGVDGWTFTKEGIYQFTLTEADPSLKGHIYDQSTYEVKITVTEKMQNGNPTGELQQLTEITKESGSIAIDKVDFANIAKAYQVNYDTGGGQPALIPSKTNVNWNDKNLLPTSNPTRIGYTFDGWKLSVTTRSATAVTNDDTYASLVGDDDTKNEITLQAKWVKNEYEVKWVSEDINHGTVSPDNTIEKVKFGEFAKTNITVTPNITADQWVFSGWEYNYLPDGLADLPNNYIKGVTLDYKNVEVKGNITFTAKFARKPFVDVNSEHGYVAMNNGSTLPTIPENIADKKTNVKIEYDENDTSTKAVAIAFENQRHYHLQKVTVSDLYGNTKTIFTNNKGESADNTFQMNDSTLTVDFNADGSLKIGNIKNSLNVRFLFAEDTKYNVNFYTQSKADVVDSTIPYASNLGLYRGDEYGQEPTVKPFKEGYTFSGWSIDGVNVNYKTTDKITDKNVSVYAIWNQNSYTVKYNLNGGFYNIATSIPDYTTTFEGANLLPSDSPRKDGYVFVGWYLNGVKIDNSMKYKELVLDDTIDSITLNAMWKANTYQIEFDKNSDKAEGVMNAQSYTYGDKKALSENLYTRVGYTFAGWATSPDTEVAYQDKEEVENLTTTANGIVKLYALWNANGSTPYKIEHYKQQKDGTWSTTPSDIVNATGKSDTTANAILMGKTDAGYENFVFDKDNDKNVLSETIAADGSLVLKVYYKQVLQVTFDMNGGTPIVDAQSIVYGDKVVKPSDPRRNGYTFIGWTHVEGKKAWNFDDEVKANMTLKAVWKKIQNTPDKPEKPKDNGNKNTVKTGDTTALNSLYIAFGSSLLLILLARKKRKEQKN